MRDTPEVDYWVDAMRAAGRASRTIVERERLLRSTGLQLREATTVELEAWLAGGEWSPATRRAYTDTLRLFYGFLRRRGLRPDDPTEPLERVRVPRSRPRPISTADLERLIAGARRHRTLGYVLLAAYAGLRVSEIARVRGEDVHGGRLTIAGKGGRVDRLPMHPRLQTYADTMPATGFWFVSPAGGPVTGANVSRVLSDLMGRLGVPGTPHALRHWYGSSLVAAGVQMRVVQESMRHANLQSTQIYAEVTEDQLEAAIGLLPTPC